MRTLVVVLNWNSPDDTVECLDSVYSSDADDYGIVVVDNGSSDQSVPTLKAWIKQAGGNSLITRVTTDDGDLYSVTRSSAKCSYLALLVRESNDGYAAGNSAGIRLARHLGPSHVWILNNDTIVEPSALRALQSRVESSKDIGVAGGVILEFERRDRIQCFGGGRLNLASTAAKLIGEGLRSDAIDRLSLASTPIDYISGASMYCSVDALASIDDLSSAYFLFYEDFECCLRLTRLGYRLAVDPEVRIYHRSGASSGSSRDISRRSPLAAFHATRSAIIFYKRNHRALAPWAVVVRSLFGLRLLLQRRSVGVAVLRGVASALTSRNVQPSPVRGV